MREIQWPGVSRRKIIIVSIIVIVAVGWFLFPAQPPEKTKALRPVIEELIAYKATHGVYPRGAKSLKSLQRLKKEYAIDLGTSPDDSELAWDPARVSLADLSVISTDGGFVLFAPTGRMKRISISSFPVWRFYSEEMKWQKGRVHWSLSYVFWSED